MEKITLAPNVWTSIRGYRLLQVVGQHAVRLGFGHEDRDESGKASYAPPTSDAPYFTTQSYDPRIIDLQDWGFTAWGSLFAMPDADHEITVVAF